MIYTVIDIAKRYGTVIVLTLVVALLGGFTSENYTVLRSAVLAEVVALSLSSLACYVYTSQSFTHGDTLNAASRIFLAVHLLVGSVYAGSYFVAFSPTGTLTP